MVRFPKIEFIINSKLEVPEADSNGLRSWLVTVSVMACGGLLPYDIRKTIDTNTFILACTNPRFKWSPLDIADKSIMKFKIDELNPAEEEDYCELKIFAYTRGPVMERCVSISQDFTGNSYSMGNPKTVTSQLLRIIEHRKNDTLNEL